MLRPGNVSHFRLSSFALLILSLTPACHGIPPGRTAAVADDVCTGATVATEALEILPDVIDIFRSGGADYSATLDRIGAGVRSVTTMTCAVTKALAHFDRAAPAASADPARPQAGGDDADAKAAERARLYLKKLNGEASPVSSAAPLAPPPPPVNTVASEGFSGVSAVCSGCSPTLRADLLPPCCPGYRTAPGGGSR